MNIQVANHNYCDIIETAISKSMTNIYKHSFRQMPTSAFVKEVFFFAVYQYVFDLIQHGKFHMKCVDA